MKTNNSFYTGLFLILIGLFFFITQYVNVSLGTHWPLIMVAGGGLFLVAAKLGNQPGLAIPGTLIAGLGGLFYYQNLNNNWASWAYAWPLILGFIGLGQLIRARLAGDNPPVTAQRLLRLSFILFLIFGTLFNGLLAPLTLLGLLLILGGLRLLVQT